MIKCLILAGGKERYHDVLLAAETLQKILTEKDILSSYSQDFSILAEEERLKNYDLIIFYTQEKIMSLEEQQGLEDYIKTGHGFIALHASNVFNGEKQQEKYQSLIGNKFLRHDPFKRFQIKTADNHFITESIEDFAIDDELYESQLLCEPDNIVAWTFNNDEKHAMLYTRKIGSGKICYLAPGHDGRAWYNPGFQNLLYRSILWAVK